MNAVHPPPMRNVLRPVIFLRLFCCFKCDERYWCCGHRAMSLPSPLITNTPGCPVFPHHKVWTTLEIDIAIALWLHLHSHCSLSTDILFSSIHPLASENLNANEEGWKQRFVIIQLAKNSEGQEGVALQRIVYHSVVAKNRQMFQLSDNCLLVRNTRW